MENLISEELLNQKIAEKESKYKRNEIWCKAVNNGICPVCGEPIIKDFKGYNGFIFRDKISIMRCSVNESHYASDFIIESTVFSKRL